MRAAILLLALAIALTACGGGGDAPDYMPTPRSTAPAGARG